MDLASAAEHYARKARLGEESIQYAHEIKVDAETLLGEFLAKAEKQHGETGGRPRKDGKPTSRRNVGFSPPTISEILGIENKAAAERLNREAQLLAKLKADAPEQHAAVRNPAPSLLAKPNPIPISG